ncbi:MAG: alkaline phosphatase D family protein [Actinomycetota bacterium]
MSAGLIFSLVALLQDALQRRRWSARHRRGALATDGTVRLLATGIPDLSDWLRRRAEYGLIALGWIIGAALLGVGATANYFRAGGYVSGVAWLWACSLLLVAALATVGAVAAVLACCGSQPPGWTWGLLTRTPLSRRPSAMGAPKAESRFAVAAGWMIGMLGLLALVIARLPSVFSGSDQRFANAIVGWPFPRWLDAAAQLGATQVVLVLAVLAVVLGRRCVTFCVVYLGAVAATFVAAFLLTAVVHRVEPLGVRLTGTTTFVWAPAAQAAVVAGLLPLVVVIRGGSRRVAAILVGVLTAGVVALAIAAVHGRDAWPTDLLGGVLLGLTAVFVARALLAAPPHHRSCAGCPWAETDGPATGMIHLSDETVRALQRGAIAWVLILAGVFAALSWTVGIPQDPEGFIVSSSLTEPLQIALVILLFVGALLAFRWQPLGAALLALAGVALGVLAAAEYPPTVGLLVTVAVLAPGFLLWLSWQRNASARRIWVLAVATVSTLTVSFTATAAGYDHLFGPTHPSSALPLLPVEGIEWAWAGGVTPTSAAVVVRTDFGVERARVRFRNAASGSVVTTRARRVPDSRIVRMRARGLTPGTRYRWRVFTDGRADHARGHGTLTTSVDGPMSFTAVVGACSRTGSDGSVFDAMQAEDPDLVVFSGDLFYENIGSNDVDAFRSAYDRALTQPAPASLLRHAPVAYLWDDHDYGPNDADRTSPSRAAARTSYRQGVPYARLGPTGPATQAFTMGRVRFIVTDERSQRSDRSILGARQMRWFLDELVRASSSHALVVWVNSVPWIGKASPGADGWSGYPRDRRRIADTVKSEGIDHLVMLAGDAHMVAIADGTHSAYASGGGGGFPLLQAAALDRPGSVKGGPYSEGAIPGGGQYGVLRVADDGMTVRVELEGRRWDGRTLLRYRFTR